MFEDSLFASTARPSPRRGWAAVISFGLQAAVLGVLVLIPMVFTDALPVSLRSYVEIPPPPGRSAPPVAQQATSRRPRTTEIVNNVLVQPSAVPTQIHQIVDEPDPGPPGNRDGVIGIPDGVGRSSQFMNDVIASTTRNVTPPPPPPVHQAVRLSSGVTDGLLIQRITPDYPYIAKIGHIQGSVVLQATIGRDGTIQNLQAVSGHPVLVKAAMEAVRRWRYRPYLLNNQAVDVDTQITVNFTLGG